MNRDDVIRMARDAGFEELFKDSHDWVCFTEEIERFFQAAYAAGAAAEREKVAAWMIHRGYATGHGDTTEDLLKELEWQVRESERKTFPDLTAVINWLENGCDPKEAAKELRLYAAAISARRKA